MQISESIKDLYLRLIAIQQVLRVPDDVTINKINVDDIVSKLAVLYEKMRNTMDYQEDHLLRRFAIERNIKRRIVLESLDPKIAQSLIEELIRSGYMANSTVPETAVVPVSVVINKYAYLIELVQDEITDLAERRKIVNWIAEVMACEIDLLLISEVRVDAMIETLYGIVRDRIKMRGATLTEREKNIQLYITLHKELVKSDNPIISYHLLNLYFPDWAHADKALTEFVASKISSVYYGIQVHLDNPIRNKIAKSLKKQTVVFKVLRELLMLHENDLVGLFSQPELLETEARKVIERNYKTTRRKLRNSSLRAILYIFITKVALAFILEYPYDKYIVGHVNQIALAINVLFPPVLMFFVTLSARLPGATNTRLIMAELKNVVYGDPGDEILCELNVKRKQGPVYFFIEYLFYMLLYGLIFGVIIYWLSLLKFNLLSGGIFIFFVTAVSFFGTRIRQLTKEYSVEHKREGLIGLFTIFFSLPIIRAGHWLSVNMRRINLFVFILDFVIEAPFKLVIEVIESWFVFLREKKEDTYKTS
jgi:ABC-type transport system involved in multi-copper enzyme maturation permease subunit